MCIYRVRHQNPNKMNNLFKLNSIRQNVKITKKLLYITILVSFSSKIILYITPFCFDPRPEAPVRSLQRVFVHINECRLDRGLERCHVRMSRLVGHSFNDAPHVVVQQIQIWTVRRPEFLGPKHVHIIR